MMLLWALFAVMTAAVLAVLLRPLAASRDQAAAGSADVAVYKDQLAEIDADLSRGLIHPSDAEVARREIARRLLAVAPDGDDKPKLAAPALRPAGMPTFSGRCSDATPMGKPVGFHALPTTTMSRVTPVCAAREARPRARSSGRVPWLRETTATVGFDTACGLLNPPMSALALTP